MTVARRSVGIGIGVAMALSLAACGTSSKQASQAPSSPSAPPATSSPTTATPSGPQSALPSQKPVPTESNPPGDIPDNTIYVPFHSSAGRFTVKVPEGWARVTRTSSVNYSNALNSVTVAWSPETSAPTVATAKSTDIPALMASQLAFRLQSVKQVRLPGGTSVEIVYQANSKPNAVTGKQYRLVIERFEFFNKGQEDILSLSSAVGSDNVDPWRIVSESFRWA